MTHTSRTGQYKDVVREISRQLGDLQIGMASIKLEVETIRALLGSDGRIKVIAPGRVTVLPPGQMLNDEGD